MSKGYNVAVVGATGAVGVEMIETLEKRDFPVLAKMHRFMKVRSQVLKSLAVALAFATIGPADAQESRQSVKSITLSECIKRALANNLDIRVERFNPPIAIWGIVREQGRYDPLWRFQSNYQDNSQPLDPQEERSLGVDTLNSKQFSSSTAVGGRLPLGTEYQLSASDARFAGTIVTNSVFTGQLGISLTQPLLKNFGLGVNSASIRIARKNRTIAVKNLARQVISTISDVENAYYDLVFTIENHKAKLEDLNGAKTLLDENRKRAAVGFLAQLEVTQAEAGAAEREEAVILAERAVEERETALKRLISQDVSELDGVSLLPVDFPVAQMVVLDKAQSIRTALEERPDFLAVKEELDRQHIAVNFTRNQLWPQIDLQGGYGLNARNGATTNTVGASFSGLIDDVTRADHPFWSVGVVVTVPIGNRQARSDYESAKLRAEQAVVNLKRFEQDIVVEVENAVGQVRTNLKRLDATRAATRLAEESLKAEEAKLRAGISTSFLVLQARTELAAARSAEIRARADYNKSLVDLARVEGATLQKHNITLAEDDQTPAFRH
ncbi:MAG: TolC family protein [Verrucomicrobiia bacterium]